MGEGYFIYHLCTSSISDTGGVTIITFEVDLAVLDFAGDFSSWFKSDRSARWDRPTATANFQTGGRLLWSEWGNSRNLVGYHLTNCSNEPVNVDIHQLFTFKHVTENMCHFRDYHFELAFFSVVGLLRSLHCIVGLAKNFVGNKS